MADIDAKIGPTNAKGRIADATMTNVATSVTDSPNPEVPSKPPKSSNTFPDAENPANNASDDVTNSMDEDDSSSEMDEDKNGTEEKPASPPTDPTELIVQAISHKEEGNTFFKKGNLIDATRSYRKGTTILKGLNKNNTGDDQVKTLLISLQTNLSMVCFKQNKHRMSRDVASKALEVDNSNVKALYRRAVASRAMGDLDAARSDLRGALKLDPSNAAVKKELSSLKKAMDDLRTQEKERLRKAFQKTGSLLYQDKEAEEKRKLNEKKEKEIAEQEALKKRKQEWEDECVRRMSNDEKAISFDDWEKERKKKEEEEEKARKRAKKEEEDRKREERKKAREAEKRTNGKGDDSSDDELTEKELSMLRGYKKTSDGRTTSYFHREQTEHEKKLIGCIKPKRLESNGESVRSSQSQSPSASPTAVTQGVSQSSSAKVGSAWNRSGTTWEEKDTTEWCKDCLTDCLKNSTAAYTSSGNAESSTYIAVVKEVKDMTGDASVALAGGKKRYIYDFHAKLKFEILDDGDSAVASGSFRLPDINSAVTGEEELEVEVLGWKKAPGGKGTILSDVHECRNMLVQDVRKSVLRFVEKFNSNF